jgi:diguanylate cyclase (GGDEF)-like protein
MHQQVLLIDDSKQIHALVTSLLGDEPVTIHSAFDGQFGIVQAASLRPDLVLLDVEMPGMDGYETCRRLKADPVTASLPIVFLTARATTEEMVQGLNLGANDYVAKPFKLSELLSRVRAALRTSHLIRLLENTALIDSLTGLGNRAMFDKRLAAEVSLRVRSGNPLACTVVDVDHFSAVNEKYGRPAGDQMLIKIGETLRAACRAEDVACRYGGQQFVVLAPQTTASQAAAFAEEMRVAIEQMSFARQGTPITATCSFGISEAHDVYDRSILPRAEEALNRSKERGRNCVSTVSTRPEPRAMAA